ncbi:MAG: hypothetical protein L0Z62_00060 [Gemmataceae bacterium]|nr:hypothetical protein [Gemmataceae bacterium]
MANPDTAAPPTSPDARAVIPVEQARYHRKDPSGPVLVARSPGFLDAWLAEAERMASDFGPRPTGVACPAAVFARPLGKRHVAVVQVADLEIDEPGRPAGLGFRFLVLPRAAYTQYLSDPFTIADRFPPPWGDSGPLPSLSTPAEPLPPRTVEDVRRVLKKVKAHALAEDQDPPTEEDDDWDREVKMAESPALLGGVQILVDGGKVVFERPGPDTELMRGLWTLLPYSARTELWPASFAFSNALGFDALIVPRAGEEFAHHSNEDQAAEYPQGNYEVRLQTAAEAGDQQALDDLFGRRSWNETWKLGVTILLFLLGVLLVLRLTEGPPAVNTERVEKLQVASSIVTARDPLTALNWLHIGYTKWPAPKGGKR